VCGVRCGVSVDMYDTRGGCSKTRKTISVDPIRISMEAWIVFSDFYFYWHFWALYCTVRVHSIMGGGWIDGWIDGWRGLEERKKVNPHNLFGQLRIHFCYIFHVLWHLLQYYIPLVPFPFLFSLNCFLLHSSLLKYLPIPSSSPHLLLNPEWHKGKKFGGGERTKRENW